MDKSDYFNTLPNEVKGRYLAKLGLTNKVDPYLLKFSQCSTDVGVFPKVTYFDILQYLVFKKSAYTDSEFRAYKSLESYKCFLSKWVRKLGVKPISNSERVIVISQVMHSQRLNLSPLNIWIVTDKKGEILCAHCTCVAGLGEACSHVGATLFALEDAVRNFEEQSVTDRKAYWVAPTSALGTPANLVEVNYSVNPADKSSDILKTDLVEENSSCPEPDDEEKKGLPDSLFNLPNKSAVLTMFPYYAEKIESSNKEKEIAIKGLLSNLYKEEYVGCDLNYLIDIAKKTDFSVDHNFVDTFTKNQCTSKMWQKFRAGRITASNFKAVCRTNLATPSLSVIKKVCYPQDMTFKSKYTAHGCKHEKIALNQFVKQIQPSHKKLLHWKVGLKIDPQNPCFGASPDSMVTCECCGEGCIEVKCPYCVKDVPVEEILSIKNSFLRKNLDNNIHLKTDHTYYYQIQMQMAVTKTKYSYFVVWTKENLFWENVIFDESFWNMESQIAKSFHEQVIVPELLGKYFTKHLNLGSSSPEAVSINTPTQAHSSTSAANVSVDKESLCLCKLPEAGRKMVLCSNNFCQIKKFHLSCVKLRTAPKRWFCKQCATVNFNKK